MISMTGAELLSRIEAVRGRLLEHEQYFDVPEIALGPTVSEAELEAIEERIGTRIPEPLRDFYLNVAGSLSFWFEVKDEPWQRAGYTDDGGHGINIVAVRELGKVEWVKGLIQITDDRGGNGWHLDTRDGGSEAVVFHAHDDPDGEEDHTEPSAAVLFDQIETLLTGNEGMSVVGEAVAELMLSGKLRPPPKPKASPAKPKRALPTHAQEHDGDRFELLAVLDEPSATRLVPLAEGRCAVAGQGQVAVYDVGSGSCVRNFTLGRPTWTLAAHPEGEQFVAGGERGLLLFSAQGDDYVASSAGNVTAVAYHPDGDRVAIGTRQGKVEVWSPTDQRRLSSLGKHEEGLVRCVAFASGDRVVSVGCDRTLRVFAPDGSELQAIRYEGFDKDGPYGPRLWVDGNRAVLAGGQLDLRSFDIDSGEPGAGSDLDLPSAAPLRAVVPSQDGSVIYAARAGSRIECWNPDGSFRFGYCAWDGSSAVGIMPLEDGRLLFASDAGWLGLVETGAVQRDVTAALELLALLESEGSFEAAASARGQDLTEARHDIQRLEAALGHHLIVPATQSGRRAKRRREPEPTKLTDWAVALLLSSIA